MPTDTGFLRHFRTCTRHDIGKFAPFYIGDSQYGWVTKELGVLLPLEMDFFVAHKDGIALAPHLDSFNKRTDALTTASAWLAVRNEKDLRFEMYPVLREWTDEPLAQIDRAAVPWFGVRGFGVHINGFIRKADGIHMWLGERAMDRQVEPGKLDNIVGGGQPIGYTIEENLCKECKEEANISPALAKTSRLVSRLGYMVERQQGLRDDSLYIFDLELPYDFIPQNTDGEVAAFHLMPASEVKDIIRITDRIKFNCNLVMIDFLHRHGLLNEADEQSIAADMQKSFLHTAQ